MVSPFGCLYSTVLWKASNQCFCIISLDYLTVFPAQPCALKPASLRPWLGSDFLNSGSGSVSFWPRIPCFKHCLLTVYSQRDWIYLLRQPRLRSPFSISPKCPRLDEASATLLGPILALKSTINIMSTWNVGF